MSTGKSVGLLLGILVIGGCQEPAQTNQPAADNPGEIQAQKATAGVGKRGQSLEDNEGLAKMITGPASALMKVEQRAIFDIQIPHALNLFRASEGRFPNSHDEFMEKIVKANRLTLPELPAGAVYRFNTEKGELWVYPEDVAP